MNGKLELQYPLSSTEKKILKDVMNELLPDLVLSINWDKYFYYQSMFESLDGFNQYVSVGGSAVVSGYGLNLQTGATLNNISAINKVPASLLGDIVLSWDKIQRFKTAISINSVSGMSAFVCIGTVAEAFPILNERIGFEIIDDKLYAISFIGSGSDPTKSLFLQDIAINTPYELEVRVFPQQQAVFFVNNIQKGVIPVAFLPTGNRDNLCEFSIQSTDGNNQQLVAGFFEYMQEK